MRCPVFAGLGVNSPPRMRAISLSSQASSIGSFASGKAKVGMLLPVKPAKTSLSGALLEASDNDALGGRCNKFVIKRGFVKQQKVIVKLQ